MKKLTAILATIGMVLPAMYSWAQSLLYVSYQGTTVEDGTNAAAGLRYDACQDAAAINERRNKNLEVVEAVNISSGISQIHFAECDDGSAPFCGAQVDCASIVFID